jgi:hypothetical protein
MLAATVAKTVLGGGITARPVVVFDNGWVAYAINSAKAILALLLERGGGRGLRGILFKRRVVEVADVLENFSPRIVVRQTRGAFGDKPTHVVGLDENGRRITLSISEALYFPAGVHVIFHGVCSILPFGQEVKKKDGGNGGNRTRDPRIKNPLLCQLSYIPPLQDKSIPHQPSKVKRKRDGASP